MADFEDDIRRKPPEVASDGLVKSRGSLFILEQDVTNLPEEFLPTAEWKSHMTPLTALEQEIKLVKFPKVYHTADQTGK